MSNRLPAEYARDVSSTNLKTALTRSDVLKYRVSRVSAPWGASGSWGGEAEAEEEGGKVVCAGANVDPVAAGLSVAPVGEGGPQG